MPCIAPLMNDNYSHLRRHLDALSGSLAQIHESIRNPPHDFARRFREFEGYVNRDCANVQNDLRHYGRTQMELEPRYQDGMECRELMKELWDVMAKIEAGLNEMEVIARRLG